MIAVWRFLFFLALISISMGAVLQHSPKLGQPTEKEQKAKKTVKQKSQNIATRTQQLVNPCQPQCPNNEPEINWWERLGTDPVATFTALLFFATWFLYRATSSLVRGAETTAQRQLRAYVALARQEALDVNQVLVFVRNDGQTTAHETFVRIVVTTTEPVVGIWGDETGVVNGPHMLVRAQGWPIIVDAGSRPHVAMRTGDRVFVYGNIDYGDVFGFRWRTNFCWIYQSKLAPHLQWQLYERHNNEEQIGAPPKQPWWRLI